MRFLPDGQHPLPALAISETLQSATMREAEAINLEVTPVDHYCLVFRYSYKLFRADNLLPWQYRERLAGAIGCTAPQVSIYPASPRALDIAIEGHQCHTAFIVVPTSFVSDEEDSYCFLVDARPILQGLMCFRTSTSPISAALVLNELNSEAPLGLRATLDDVASVDTLVDIRPGQVLIARYIPLEELTRSNGMSDNLEEDEGGVFSPANSVTVSSDDQNLRDGEQSDSAYQVLVPCMLFMPDYCPELYEVAVYLPTGSDDFVDRVLDTRSQHRQDIAPCPYIVRPQPDTAFASLLMLPSWPVDHCVVLVDGRAVDCRLFAVCLSPLIDRRSLLIAAAYEPDQPLDVYVRDSPWPLRADVAMPLYTGDLVAVTPSTHLASETGYLHEMLRSPDSWDSAAVPAERPQGFTLILHDAEPLLFACRGHGHEDAMSSDSVDSIDARAAESISGGEPGIALPVGYREVQAGTVLTVHFRALASDSAPLPEVGEDSAPIECASFSGQHIQHRASALPLVSFAVRDVGLDDSLGHGHRRRGPRGSRRLLPSREPMRTCMVSIVAIMQVGVSMASEQGDLHCHSTCVTSYCLDVYCTRHWCPTSAVASLVIALLQVILGVGSLWGLLSLLSYLLLSSAPLARPHGLTLFGSTTTVPPDPSQPGSESRQRPSRHNRNSHWQESHQGNRDNSEAPSSQNGGHELGPAGQVRPAGTTSVVTDPGFGTRVPFLIFSHEYWPEQVVARLVLPARVREALAALEQRRTATAQRRSPRLIPVFPQPREGVASVLALPHWDFEGVPVLVDCHVVPVKMFCALLPGWILREAFLQYLGIPVEQPCHVFLRDVPWPLQRGAYLFPQPGDLVTICMPLDDPGPLIELSQLLEPDHVWDFAFAPPGEDDDVNWVLSDGIHVALPILGDSFALSSIHTADALGLEAGQFVLVPAVPAIEDHARLGLCS